jgi:hypothetical protein
MAAVATCPAASRRIHTVHMPRATAAISSRRLYPWLSPTVAARGIQSPVHLPAAGGEGEKERRRRSSEAPGAAPPAAKPEPPARRSRTRGATHACDLCFLDFLSVAPFCFPYQRRLPPRHSAAHPFTDACTSARGHPGEDAASPPLWTPWPSSRGGTPPCRRAAASEAGHRARLGCHFLQEPLPSSTRARSLVYLLLVAVACRAVPLVTATPRHGRIRARARDHAGPTPLRPRAPQHTRTPIWGQGRAFDPVRLRLSSPPSSRVPASPRPCRGRASRARGLQGEGHRFLGRHGRPYLTEPRTHTRS